ncbi:hypothetical protein H4N54_03550 [Limnospira fusiformis KN01]|uniref:Uncharacterized protein n=1 Tax=Limnospira fusiformis PMC 851.14 TaxID=2219512 RepID=A0ABU9EKZ2_LIMFS|nr:MULTISPECIES: hypothetical protein [Limnospira]MDT9186886.1 hypothetical protein [Limnospira sp. PMC 894.15]MDT9197509.1 hypothetical protein [Limnospira sp. PMC 1042.18]MDT9233286.1 hypothetical protein [Limnospira sp. PMC 917.15]MDT9274079.1 hypothetical protein [Limnospira sp. PMC 737.11]ULB46458.1 hypothetical protein H4N54_03550 [Limnospira fusiformis KN01]
MSDRIPSDFQIIEDFLTWLEQAKTDPQNYPQLSENLQALEDELTAAEDKTLKLAKIIKGWCNKHQITEQLITVRLHMAQQGDEIPKPAEGERPEIVYNKALLVARVREGKEAAQS